ncbi:ABC transporter [Cryptosporidium felis]|nr:ABC transporter [Cryptosporidium felis]
MWAKGSRSQRSLELHSLLVRAVKIHVLPDTVKRAFSTSKIFFPSGPAVGQTHFCMHTRWASTVSKRGVLLRVLRRSQLFQEKDLRTVEVLGKYLWPHSKEHRKRILLSLLSLGVAKVATIQAPLLLSKLVNSLGNLDPSDLVSPFGARLSSLLLIGAYGVARISSSGFNELRNALFSEVSQSACRDVSLYAFHHFHNISSLGFLQSHRTGELLTIITRGFKSVSQLLNIMIFQIIPTTAEFLLVLGILLHKVGYEVALITLVTMAAYMDFTRRITHKRTAYRKRMNSCEQRSNGLLSDSLINAETLKYLSGERRIYELYSALQETFKNSNVKVQTSLAFLNFGQNCILTGGLLSSMLFTTNKVLSGTLPIGSIVLVTSLLFQLAIPLNFIGMIYRETKLAMIDLGKLNKYLTVEPEAEEKRWISQEPLNKLDDRSSTVELYKVEAENGRMDGGSAIELKNVSFRFKTRIGGEHKHLETKEELKDLVIDDISLRIPLGKRIGLVGSSGSGKTTLARLIYRIFELESGSIEIFGRNITDFDIHEYRQCFSALPQDILLFNMSVADNLRLASRNVSLETMVAACRLAGVHENVIRMKKGYDTFVGERGCSLSGGERQRLGFARMLIKRSPIWILDEPTSALDQINHNNLVKILSKLHSYSISAGNSAKMTQPRETKYRDILDQIPNIKNGAEALSIVRLIDEIVRLPITMIIIAHRLSSVRNLDSIAYLEKGRVKEVGNHNQLIDNKMYYYQLWNKQHIDGILR